MSREYIKHYLNQLREGHDYQVYGSLLMRPSTAIPHASSSIKRKKEKNPPPHSNTREHDAFPVLFLSHKDRVRPLPSLIYEGGSLAFARVRGVEIIALLRAVLFQTITLPRNSLIY